MRFHRPPFGNRSHNQPRDRNMGMPPRRAELHDDGDVPDVERDDDEGGVRREAEYLRELTDNHTPIVVHLRSGESFEGFIEYYDRRFIRLTRQGAPNLFIYKHDIKYLAESR